MSATRTKHILITVFGSLGDLHPLMGLAMGLQQRGHRVTIASSELYREKVTQEGIGFAKLRPDHSDFDKRVFDELFDPIRGPERLMRKYILPYMREMYEDLLPLLDSADFLVNSPLVYAGPLAAEVLKKPWASIALQPQLFFSIHDPTILPILPVSEHWYHWSPRFWKLFFSFIQSATTSWPQEIYALQKELGVPFHGNPIFEGQFSSHLNLAMFSDVIAPPQPDWPANTHATGFVFYDRMKPGEETLPPAVQSFIEAGEAPVVFTLGSSVVNTAGNFYEISITAAKKLGCRAIFLAGDNQPAEPLTDNMLLWDYASYSQLFPHAAAVVHQGGMGTTAQVMRAGKPMLVVPRGFDQPDNAARVKRLGISRTLYPKHYTVNRALQELTPILQDPAYRESAVKVARQIQQEDGVAAACNLIEPYLK